MKSSIRAKLAWAFGLLALIVLLVSGFAFKELKDANDEFELFVTGINARLPAEFCGVIDGLVLADSTCLP